jgi:hypothetical protein
MELKIVGLKTAKKHDAQQAYKALDAQHDAGETDYYEVLGMWKNEKGKVHAKYYGNHDRLAGTVVGLFFGVIPAVAGYYIGKHYEMKGRTSTKFLEGLSAHVDDGGAAIFALVDANEADALAAYFAETYPGSTVDIIDPEPFQADLVILAEEVEADAAGAATA